ncbi:nitrite reductase (NAD(P)H) small subunit, partial [Beijerinckia sp. L45]|uniref:nitrite reductase (NAD(P)H) small subunit n=1 Tax=Beijerinckia sp. L45 TaxID=1641855 RepID=UPI0034CD8F90
MIVADEYVRRRLTDIHDVRCPWHKAAFSLSTGKCVEPPAVDDLPRFAVRVVDGRVMLTVPEQSGLE